MICPKCYHVVDDETVICPYCGVVTKNQSSNSKILVDETNCALAIMSFLLSLFIPYGVIFGFTLWAAKTDLQPKSAKVYGMCAILPWFLKWMLPRLGKFLVKAIVVITIIAIILIALIAVVVYFALAYAGVLPMVI